MSLEDAKKRLQESQDKLQAEQGRRDQAYGEQTAIENELSQMFSEAVKNSIYSQDENIIQLKKEVHRLNEQYEFIRRDIDQLDYLLTDTTHLQTVYNAKFKELEEKHQERKQNLDSAYKQLVEANNIRIDKANADADDKLKRIDKKLEDLRAKKMEEERKLRGEIEWFRTKAVAIIIGIIATFIIAMFIGIAIGSGNVVSSTPF